MEDVVLFEQCGQLACRGFLRLGRRLVTPEIVGGPHEERYLILLLGREFHGQAMHEHVVFTQRLTVVGDEDHGSVPICQSAQGVDEPVEQEVGVADGVVVGIHQVIYWLIDMEFLRTLVGVLRAVTGAGVQDDEHLVLLAGEDALTQASEENAVIIPVDIGVHLAQIDIREVFVDMDGRLTPVVGAPRHIDTRAEGVVGQQLIEVAAVDGLEDGFGASRGVGSAGVGLIDLQSFLFR